MTVIIGQVYNPHFRTKTENGKEKTSFSFSLATRKAFIDEDKTKPNLFTQAVTYQAGLAKMLNEYFGKEEHKGKSIVVYGHFNEYQWEPDGENPDHDKYFQEFKITRDILESGDIRLAEGSAEDITILVPIRQTTRQFVVTGFEFADSASSTPRTPKTEKTPSKIKVAGVSAGTTTTDSLPKDDNSPF